MKKQNRQNEGGRPGYASRALSVCGKTVDFSKIRRFGLFLLKFSMDSKGFWCFGRMKRTIFQQICPGIDRSAEFRERKCTEFSKNKIKTGNLLKKSFSGNPEFSRNLIFQRYLLNSDIAACKGRFC